MSWISLYRFEDVASFFRFYRFLAIFGICFLKTKEDEGQVSWCSALTSNWKVLWRKCPCVYVYSRYSSWSIKHIESSIMFSDKLSKRLKAALASQITETFTTSLSFDETSWSGNPLQKIQYLHFRLTSLGIWTRGYLKSLTDECYIIGAQDGDIQAPVKSPERLQIRRRHAGIPQEGKKRQSVRVSGEVAKVKLYPGVLNFSS
jgi:hypothetical protein